MHAHRMHQCRLQRALIVCFRHLGVWLHMHLFDRVHWDNVFALRSELHGLSNLCAHRVHQCRQLQQPRIIRERRHRQRLHMHLQHRLHGHGL